MEDAVVSLEQLQEYQRQLADVNELLAASPEDAALLSLKSDLEELMALAQASFAATDSNNITNELLEAPSHETVGVQPSEVAAEAFATTTATDAASEPTDQNEVVGSEPEKPLQQTAAKKKSKKVKEFEVPAHLLIHEADTEAEKNRKRRAIKALKNKWRERKKEVETEMKQQSWQSFQQKTLKKRKDENTSIFATQEGDHAAKVGVVSASRGMTEFGERKRHKHT